MPASGGFRRASPGARDEARASAAILQSINQGEDIMSDTKKPVSKVQLYPVSAAVWRNHSDEGEAFYNVTFERSYKDQAGNWQSSSTFGLSDLLLLAKVADRAHSEIYKLRASDRQAGKLDE
jgi:hypothetical protein